MNNQLKIGKNMKVELQIPPSHHDILTTPRGGRTGTGVGIRGVYQFPNGDFAPFIERFSNQVSAYLEEI
jgi:hypothetical protein